MSSNASRPEADPNPSCYPVQSSNPIIWDLEQIAQAVSKWLLVAAALVVCVWAVLM